MKDVIRVKPEELFDFSLKILTRVGVGEEDAKTIAENLVLANLRGTDSHGVVRLPSYIRRVKKGLIDPQGAIDIVKDHEGTALIDAHNSFGQVAALRATLLATRKARKFGVAIVGVKNANHFGIAAYYVSKLTKHKFIGIVLSNAPPAIAPWGGTIPMFGTNPICIGFPIEKGDAIILDMAVSTVARGKIRLAALRGEEIPEGWAFDDGGKPTTDPEAALMGTLTPIGGPKGYGLSLSVDMLCGVLTGSMFGWKVKALDDFSGPSGTGFFIGAIDIRFFRPYEEYQKDIVDYVRKIKNSPMREEIKEIFLPGEMERKEAELRRSLGIPLDRKTLSSLRKLAEISDIPFTFTKLNINDPPKDTYRITRVK